MCERGQIRRGDLPGGDVTCKLPGPPKQVRGMKYGSVGRVKRYLDGCWVIAGRAGTELVHLPGPRPSVSPKSPGTGTDWVTRPPRTAIRQLWNKGCPPRRPNISTHRISPQKWIPISRERRGTFYPIWGVSRGMSEDRVLRARLRVWGRGPPGGWGGVCPAGRDLGQCHAAVRAGAELVGSRVWGWACPLSRGVGTGIPTLVYPEGIFSNWSWCQCWEWRTGVRGTCMSATTRRPAVGDSCSPTPLGFSRGSGAPAGGRGACASATHTPA